MSVHQWLEIQHESGARDLRTVRPHIENMEIGVVDGACPGCGADPFLIRASSPQILNHSRLRGNGHAECCGDPVGYVYAERSTIFGLEEDRSMLDKDHQRARVYR